MAEEAQPEDPRIAEALEAAKQRGLTLGLNIGLLAVAVPCALVAAVRSYIDVPTFENIFRHRREDPDALTLLVLDTYQVVALILLLAAIACPIATRIWRDRRAMVFQNAAFLVLTMVWMTILWTSIYQPFVRLMNSMR